MLNPNGLKSSQIAYLDSSRIGGMDNNKNRNSKGHLLEDDDRTPIEVWLDRVQRNLVVVRKEYFS